MKTIFKSVFFLPAVCLFVAGCTSSPSAKEGVEAKKAGLVIVAHITTTAEYQAGIEKVFEAVVAGTRREEGCVSYVLYQHRDNRLKYTFIEEWVSQAAIEAHHNSAHYKAFAAATEGKVDVEVFVMEKKY
jgi:quinol monooxygenase YgiN